MILRRITQHVKEQNWFAVVLDLLIVILGVFLGIQIGNWNEDRLDEIAYQKAHDRMILETRSNLQSAQNLLDLTSPVLDNFTLATNDLRDCHDNEEAQARISHAIKLLNGTFSLRLDNRAISELTTSQRLLERQSSMRIELYSGYDRKVNTVISWSEKVLDKMEHRSDGLHSFIGYGDITVSPITGQTEGRDLILTVDLSEACKDAAFRKVFYDWESGHSYQVSLIQKFIEDSQTYLAELGEAPNNGEGEF